MNPLQAYIDGWRRHDAAAVLGTLTDTCVVVESYGPVYHGRDRVERWMRSWFDAGGTVDAWVVTSFADAGGTLVAEWRFSCTWQGVRSQFEGVSVARVVDGRIAYLREYATTAPLYEWTGTWRD